MKPIIEATIQITRRMDNKVITSEDEFEICSFEVLIFQYPARTLF